MTKKIQITLKQAEQFNRMLKGLKRISKSYATLTQLHREYDGDHTGLYFEEAIEMAYENIQEDARIYSHNIKPLNLCIAPAEKSQKIVTPGSVPPVGMSDAKPKQ